MASRVRSWAASANSAIGSSEHTVGQHDGLPQIHILRMSVPYARIWWPSSQGSSSPLELESADPRSFLTSADVWSGAATGKEGRQGIENPFPFSL